MAPPPVGGKRKRGDRSWSGDGSHDGLRPSPHRPGNLNMAQNNQGHNVGYGREYQDGRARGGRRPSRGGRGGAYLQSSRCGQPQMNPPSQIQPLSNGQNISQDSQPDGATSSSPLPIVRRAAALDFKLKLGEYDFAYMTTGVCEAWETSGKASILEQGSQARSTEDLLVLSSIFQELIRAALEGKVSPTEAGHVVTDITGEQNINTPKGVLEYHTPSFAQATFLDSLSIFSDALETSLTPSSLRMFMSSCGIPTKLLRQELDASLLQSLGLIRDSFARMGIRKQTNILYRQANFNLMREESEGFAKLMTDLFTTSGNEPPSAEVVEETVERVKAMIGAFDLDVGRTLDVVLDVFGAVLVKQFRFFVKFLRASPWWPREEDHTKSREPLSQPGGVPPWALPGFPGWSLNDDQRDAVARLSQSRDRAFWERAKEVGLQAFYEIGRRRATDEELKRIHSPVSATQGHQDVLKQWIKETGTLPPKGNHDAAQLLGFKLRFYSSSGARNEQDVLPDNLICLSALLIKVGFISLQDLYPHIWRSDEEMEVLRQEKLKEKAERERAARPGAGARNALLLAGALEDDTLPIPSRLREPETRGATPSKEVEGEKTRATSGDSKDALSQPADQKVLLLKSLLAIGALPESLFILGRFPWLLDLYPELPEYIHRILHHTLSSVYADSKPLASRSSLHEQKPAAENEIPGVPKGQVRLVDQPARKVLRWALLDKDDSGNDGLDYRFYWDEWSDSVPVCQTVDDVFILCNTLLNLVGVKIGQDVTLLLKLARIGKVSLSQDTSETNRARWFDLSKRLLVPALSLTKSNAGVVNEVFELLSIFPIDARYLVYLEWSSGKTSRNPDMKTAFDQARAETKDVLKRISKTNLRAMARALAKIAYANPHIVITTALAQIEVYDSIAEAFVEGARYFTDLGYDVLTWALISSMGRAGRSRVQEQGGGMFTSHWLSALASFAGKIFKRYNIMRPGPLLQYVASQLDQGNTTDLIVLEQIILSMAGITTDTNYSDAQLQAMGGGELLQSQTILQLLDRRHESKLTSKRLIRSLRETDLAGHLLLSMAQRRQACIFDADNAAEPLKLLGNIFDEIHRVMIQYLDLLRSNLSIEEFGANVPDVVQLMLNYGIHPEIAFWFSRPNIAQRMAEIDREEAEKRKPSDLASNDITNNDIDIMDHLNGAIEEDGEAGEALEVAETATTPTPAEISGTTLTADSPDKQTSISSPEPDTPNLQWHPVLQNIMEALQPHLPKEVVDTIGTGFYVTFWQLSLYDVSIPGKSYEEELSKQHKRISTISTDRSDISIAGTKKKDAEKKQISGLIDRLLSENKQHLKSFGESKARLFQEKGQWFQGMSRRAESLNSALLEHCFSPRILASPLDSYFCFKFSKFLHTSGTPNFRTMGFYDLIFHQNRLTSLIFACTSKEADNLGRFLNELLKDLSRWHKDKAVYEKEGFGSKRNLPGFARRLHNDGRPEAFLDFENFRRLLYKWHNMVFGALQNCLSSSEYMHIRNAISVLKSISKNFPIINFHGLSLQKLVDALGKSSMEDIMVSSKAVMGELNKREKSWVLPQAFRKGQEKLVDNVNVSKASTPQAFATSLSAEAPDFKPSTSLQNGASDSHEAQRINKAAAEDGEVKDAEMVDAVVVASVAPVQVVDTSEENGVFSDTQISVERVDTPEEPVQLASQEPITRQPNPPTPEPSQPVAVRQEVGSVTSFRVEDGAEGIAPKVDIPKRPDTARATPPATFLRSHPNLPNRPEHVDSHLPTRPERYESRNLRLNESRFSVRSASAMEPRRDSRDSRMQEHSRHPRPSERGQRSALEEPAGYGSRSQDRERLASDRDKSDYARGLARDHAPRHANEDRPSQPLTRASGPPMWDPERSARNRQPPEQNRGRQDDDRPRRDGPMPPPKPPAAHVPESVNVNPARAALINGNIDSRPGMSIRGQSEEKSARKTRPDSPRGRDEDRAPSRPDKREEIVHGSDQQHQGHRGRPEEAFAPGPRGQWLERPSSFSNEYSGESRRQHPQQPPVDMNHGRLNQDSRPPLRQQDAMPDRPPPSPEVPSGPRGRPSGSGPWARNAPPPPPNHLNTQQSLQQDPNTTPLGTGRQTPTGPATRSHNRTNSYYEQSAAASTTTIDTAGVHPDRLRLIPTTSGESSPPRPSPLQALHHSAPAGPRGNAPSGAPSGPSPTTRGPSSGPQFSNDGPMRGGRNNRHPLAAVNSTLAQAGQGTSIRGRGGMRQASGPITPHSGPSASMGGPGQGAGPRSEVSFPHQQQQEDSNGRPDLFATHNAQHVNGAIAAPIHHGSRTPSQRGDGHRDDLTSLRPPPSSRRGELIIENDEAGKKSSRHSSRDRDVSGHRSEKEDGHHERDRERDRESHRGGREHGRERERDYDRGQGHDPGRETGRERYSDGGEVGYREPSRGLRREEPRSVAVPSRRSGRGQEEQSNDVVAPPPPPTYDRESDRDRRSGYSSGATDRARARGSERDNRIPRDGGSARNNDLPPRKHEREEDRNAPYGAGRGGGRGGMRMASESKRPRRGP